MIRLVWEPETSILPLSMPSHTLSLPALAGMTANVRVSPSSANTASTTVSVLLAKRVVPVRVVIPLAPFVAP